MTQRVFSEIAILADATLKLEMAAQCGKFQDFSVIQILREINFGEITVFAILAQCGKRRNSLLSNFFRQINFRMKFFSGSVNLTEFLPQNIGT